MTYNDTLFPAGVKIALVTYCFYYTYFLLLCDCDFLRILYIES